MTGEKKVKIVLIIITIIAFGLVIIACKANAKEKKMNAAKEKTVIFESIGQGNSDWNPAQGFYGPQFLRFTSQKSWKAQKHLFFFYETSEDLQNRIERVDFAKQEILIFTYGRTGTTGYAIALEKIVVRDGITLMHLQGKRPDPYETTGQMLCHPFDTVIVNKGDISEALEFYISGNKTEFTINAH